MQPLHITQFQSFILNYHQHYGRHSLPWRTDASPYRVLVSEIMLQQTQVDRVIPKFNQFMFAFPNVQSLASASVSDVIKQWQGLGYNRRGLNLQRAAQTIVSTFNGVVPSTTTELLSLPGIGPYTAAAIQAFAFNQPSVVIETNIRAVFIYHFLHQAYKISDNDLLPLLEATLWQDNPRQWYSALMDYGSFLKQVLPNPTRQSRHYSKQSPFSGSLRQVRGKIIACLTEYDRITLTELKNTIGFEPTKVDTAIDQLITEGFLDQELDSISLKR